MTENFVCYTMKLQHSMQLSCIEKADYLIFYLQMGLENLLLFSIETAQRDLLIFNHRGGTSLHRGGTETCFQTHTSRRGTTIWLCRKSQAH